ncbi:MAG: dipeptidase, partial [Candidatus Dormibacteraceae bacterium]
ALCITTSVARSTGVGSSGADFPSAAQAHASARGQFAYYRALEQLGHVEVLEDAAALRAHVERWKAWEAAGAPEAEAPRLGFVLSMESADPILEPENTEEWRRVGIRLIGPAHFGPGRYAGGTGVESGLTERGRRLLREMRRVGIGLDVTHLSDRAFWEALDLYDGPVIASHNNCRALVPHQRQFTDQQLRALIERDAVIGSVGDVWMLEPSLVPGAPNDGILLERIVDHVDHVCQLAGDARHSGIGSDLDGGFGRKQSPADLDTIADLQRLADLLRGRGYAEDDVAAILHGNWFRCLEHLLAT